MAYIEDIISSDLIRAVISCSVMLMMNAGQIPRVSRQRVMSIAGIMMPVRGSEMRFVMRKCFGNVPK